ncbi:MAG: glycosyltransferase [Chloroflexota bacterium]
MKLDPGCVIIAGMHRSGTSLAARLLNLAGVDLGDEGGMLPASEANPKGFWEQNRILELHDRILAQYGGSWSDPPYLPPGWGEAPELEPLRIEARDMVGSMFEHERLFGWKDPRSSLLIPFWRSIVPKLRVVLCIRNPIEVTESLLAQHQISPRRSYALWQIYTERALADSRPDERIILRHDDLMSDWRAALEPVLELLGLRAVEGASAEQADAFLEARLRHHSHSWQDVLRNSQAPLEAKLLYRSLTETKDSADLDAAFAGMAADPRPFTVLDEDMPNRWATTQALLNRLAAIESEGVELRRNLSGALAAVEDQRAAVDDLRARHEQAEHSLVAEAQAMRRLEGDLLAAAQRETQLRAEVKLWTEHWEQVQQTMAWKAATRLQGARHRLAPSGTKREAAWLKTTRRKAAVSAESTPAEETAHADITPYQRWVAGCEARRYNPDRLKSRLDSLSSHPTICVIMPVYDSDERFLRAAIESVLHQSYENWELCICDDASPQQHIRDVLREYAAADRRIKLAFNNVNAGIARASQRALGLANGEFIALLDHDDELTPDALTEVAHSLQTTGADVLYTDEDKRDVNGKRREPFFKPAWSPDLLLSCMYLGHLTVYRKELVDSVGGFRGDLDGSQDYDLALRVTERTDRIAHLPMILYHWRQLPGSAAADPDAKNYALSAAKRALQDAMSRRGVDAEVDSANSAGPYRVRRAVAPTARVSIILPTRNRVHLLARCIDSIEATTDPSLYEIIVVDNGSDDPRLATYLSRSRHRVIRDDGPFNHSRLNNLAAVEADGDYVLLLNNDTEALKSGWLNAMVEHAQRPEVGAVGALLLYPDSSIQHAGVVLGVGGVAGHAFRFADSSVPGYFNLSHAVRNCSAVTGACLLMRRDLYLEMGGLDESRLPVAYNDVDLCLRLRRRGFLIVTTPYAVLRHHESISRGREVIESERHLVRDLWLSEIAADPYYNPNLSLAREDFAPNLLFDDSSFRVTHGSHPKEVAGPIIGGRSIGQEFVADAGGLRGLAIQFAAYGAARRMSIDLTLEDCSRPGEPLARVRMDDAEIRDNEYHTFEFSPLLDSSGRRFYFYMQQLGAPAGPIGVRRTTAIEPSTGPAFEDHEPIGGTLSFIAAYDGQPARMPIAPIVPVAR